MNQAAKYLIVQHMPDLFRREAQNVGVIVRINGAVAAKFFGENSSDILDARKTRVLPSPGTYTQWVEYWRRVLSKRSSEEAWTEIMHTARDHYQVIDGGMVDGIREGTMEDVVNFLYSALVSEGGIASALGAPDEEEAVIRLAMDIESELKKQHLLTTSGGDLFGRINHPVTKSVPVEGAKATHILSFVQRNGHDVVMEPIDLSVRRDRKRMRERAGWASRVFEDVKAKRADTEAIALISAGADETNDKDARYALDLLSPYATIVNWQMAHDREMFIKDRMALAVSNA